MAARSKEKPRAEVTAREKETLGLPSASGFDAEFRCLGKRELCRQLPGMQTKYASRGTLIHTALETNDLSGLTKSDAVTAERIMYGEAELIDAHGFEGAQLIAEQRLWYADKKLKPLFSAKMDGIHLKKREGRAMSLNYKTGFGDVVPLEFNWQVKTEAVVTWSNYGVKSVVAGLIHPHHPDTLYQVREFTATELGVIAETIAGYAKILATKTDLQRTPNAISCRFCDAKFCCPEYRAKQEATKAEIMAARDGKALTVLMNRTPEERSVIVRDAKQLKKDVEEFLDECKAMLKKDPDSIHGWQLRNAWQIIIKDEIEAIILTKKNWGEEGVAAATKFSVSGLEIYLNEKCGFTKKDAKEKVKQILKKVIQWKPKDPSLELKRG